MQSRIMSATEAMVNIAIGYAVSVTANLLVLPLFGYDVTFGDSLAIGFAFTVISLIRSYVVRRLFNRIER